MLKIGHRGAKAYAIENTVAAIYKALELSVDMVELDIRITRDKHPVVIHASQLRLVAKKYGRVSKTDLVALKRLKVKGKETVPTLGEVLEAIDNRVGINLELKVKNSAQIVVQTLRDYKVDLTTVMISSNHPGEVRMAKEMEPSLTTAIVFRAGNAFNFWFISDFLAILFLPITKYYISWLVRNARADYLNIHHRFLDEQKIEAFHRQGIKICAWTVNNPKKIASLKQWNIDGIITNYPDRL
jgi:glycerophosphoryl diester phosphodiesterase